MMEFATLSEYTKQVQEHKYYVVKLLGLGKKIIIPSSGLGIVKNFRQF